MASAWFYQIDGNKHGPVSSTELAGLARSGKLKPTDLVQKEGMAEWQPAGRVKGLFPSAAAPAPAPPAPPAEPPSVASAAKGLFDAVATAAKRVGEKAAEAAKQPPAKPRAKPTAATDSETEDTSPSDSSPEQPARPKVSRRTMIVAGAAGGALLLSCVVCGVVGFVVGPKPGAQPGLGVSQERLLRPKPDVNLENMFGSFGCDPVLKKNDRDVRVWAFGKHNRLAATGPEANLTGVMVLQGYSTSESDNAVGVMLTMVVMAPILNSQFEAEGKWAEGDELLRWMTGLMEKKGSGVRVVNGRRVQYTVKPPLCSVLIITPEGQSVDPDDAIKLVLGK